MHFHDEYRCHLSGQLPADRYVGDSVREVWITESLRARFCGHHRAGELLHDEMREVLREPAPDMRVVTVYQRVMMLGYLGGYRALDAEDRLVLKHQLDAQACESRSWGR